MSANTGPNIITEITYRSPAASFGMVGPAAAAGFYIAGRAYSAGASERQASVMAATAGAATAAAVGLVSGVKNQELVHLVLFGTIIGRAAESPARPGGAHNGIDLKIAAVICGVMCGVITRGMHALVSAAVNEFNY